MQNHKHYSDEDFQMIIDNRYAGNHSEFELHLKSCDLCNKNFNAYSAVKSFIKYKIEIPAAETDLAEIVLRNLPAKRSANLLADRLLNWILIVFSLLTLYFSLNILSGTNLTMCIIIVLVFFFGAHFWISFKESSILVSKFSKLINL